MSPSFTITVDPLRSIVRMWMSGFFSPLDIDRFRTERSAAHELLRCGPNEHLTLVDIRQMAVQSQEAVVEFQKVMHTPSVYSRKIAIVVNKSLSRSQIKRAAEGRDVGYFETVEHAEQWLFEDAPATA